MFESDKLRQKIRTVINYNFVKSLTIDKCLNKLKTVAAFWYSESNGKKWIKWDILICHKPADNVDRQIEEILQINASSIYKTFLHKRLHVRKVCTLRVPHFLTEEQNACKEKWYQEIIKNYKNGDI